MSFKEKYLKYKNKYLLLKNKIKQTGGNHELYVAVSNNDLDQVKEIVGKGKRMQDDDLQTIDYNYVQSDGALGGLGKNKKMVNIAIANNNLDILEILLNSRTIDINYKDENGNTYVMNAISRGNINIINFILKFNPDLKLTNNKGNTALQLAAISGNVDLVNFLKSYLESLMEEEVYLYPNEPDIPMINYVLPGEIVALIDSFTTTTRLVIAPGIYRYITAAEGDVLKNCVRKDFVNYIDTIRYPLDKIIRDLQPSIEKKPVLIIDGENVLGEFRLPNGIFYDQRLGSRYRFFLRNNIAYEINILLLFIIYCRNKNYGKLIIVCKNNSHFDRLLDEYNSGTIRIRNWDAYTGIRQADKIIQSADVKAVIGFHFTVDIIHVTADCSAYTGIYPKDLRSYDDCLILGLVFKYYRQGIPVFYYTKDKRMLYDYYTEKHKLLPFVVTINKQTPFLFQPHLEPDFFVVSSYQNDPLSNTVLNLNILNDYKIILDTYMDAVQ